jgi:hypothetical protein
MRRERAIDERIAELAARQGGVISRKQLFGLGLSAAAIDHRVRRGVLHLVHRGVYAVGHRLVSARGKHFAALLAVNGSALSFASAGASWDLCEDGGRRVHVTVIGRGGRRERPGLVIHRCRLTDDEIVRRDGLVLTSPERTLLDLAGTLSVTALEQCLVRAVALRRFDRRALDGLIERSPHRARNGTGGRLPLVAPLKTFERDRARDAALLLAGWRVLRFTWRQVTREPERVAAVVRRSMAR